MTHAGERRPSLADLSGQGALLDRALLRERAAEMLRDYISSGRIPEGTKLTEREVSEWLGISRMPAREALMILEAEGLVVTRSGGRYVIELTAADVRDLHELRWTLERLAVERAAAYVDDDGREELRERAREFEAAAVEGDANLRTKADIALHQAIWRQARNPHLLRVLQAMLGTIFVLADRAEGRSGRDALLSARAHSEMVELIVAGRGAEAAEAIVAQIRAALEQSLGTFQVSGEGDGAG
jgi:DNA-binding GntR family transcriptional regulator